MPHNLVKLFKLCVLEMTKELLKTRICIWILLSPILHLIDGIKLAYHYSFYCVLWKMLVYITSLSFVQNAFPNIGMLMKENLHKFMPFIPNSITATKFYWDGRPWNKRFDYVYMTIIMCYSIFLGYIILQIV